MESGWRTRLLIALLVVLTAPIRLSEASAQDPEASITLAPTSGQTGTTVELTGSGFRTEESCGPVAVYLGDRFLDYATMTGPDGDVQISLTFDVPQPSGGEFEPGEVMVTAVQTKRSTTTVAVVGPCVHGDEAPFRYLTFQVAPTGSEPGAVVTATGTGFYPDVAKCGTIVIHFDGERLTDVTPLSDGSFTTTFPAPGRPAGTYEVEANQGPACGEGSDVRAVASYELLGENLALDPAEGASGSSTLATGTGFSSELPLVLEFDGEAVVDEPAGTTMFITSDTFEAPFTVPERPPGTYAVVACQPGCGDPDRVARTTFVVREGPGLLLDPAVGPPGFVTRATGAGFPADSLIVLVWEPGIGELAVQTDASGSFTAQVLVFHNDILGVRELRAQLPGGAEAEGEPPAAPLAVAEFVVTAGTQQPRDFSMRR